MGFISVILVLVFIVCYHLSKLMQKQTMKYIFSRLLYEGSVTLAMFCALNIGFSSGIHFRYSKYNTQNP